MRSGWNWRHTVGVTLVLAAAAAVWSYWTYFEWLGERWSIDPLYSHCYLVPLFAAALLWIRREAIPTAPLQPSWWAVAFLAVGAGLRLVAAYYYLTYPAGASILFMLFGAALAIGGWGAVRWTWPAILFLHFMLPFPGVIEDGIIRPLQRAATLASTNALQTMGFFAQADGNIIVLSEAEMGVVEACSGLRMVSVFAALTVGACFLLERPAWQKGVVALSAFPIAVLCNVARITSTGVMYEYASRDFAGNFFHNWAGYLMMPLALLLLLAELRVLDWIFVIDSAKALSQTASPPRVGQKPPGVPSVSTESSLV